MEDNNLILIFVSLVAGQVSWGMEEPTWSEYIQTGVTFFKCLIELCVQFS